MHTVTQLQRILSPFKTLCSRNALSARYKTLYLSASKAAGCASYGLLEAVIELPLAEPCYVDTMTFLSVLDSLPDGAALTLEVQNGALVWSAGHARGKMGTVAIDDMPTFAQQKIPTASEAPRYRTSSALARALKCGTLSCTNPALASIGMYGVVVDNREFASICTSDNTTAAFCPFGDVPAAGFPEQCCLPPEGVTLLSGIMGTSGDICCTEEALIYVDKTYNYLLRTIPPLKHDIRAIVDRFSAMDVLVPIPPDRISAFIKRATALAETKKGTTVSLSASGGKLNIAFEDGASQSDEYFLVENVELPDMPPVKVDATALSRALAQSKELVLDYMDQRVVVLTNSAELFIYIISGVK